MKHRFLLAVLWAPLIGSIQWKLDLLQMFDVLPRRSVICPPDSFFLVMSTQGYISLQKKKKKKKKTPQPSTYTNEQSVRAGRRRSVKRAWPTDGINHARRYSHAKFIIFFFLADRRNDFGSLAAHGDLRLKEMRLVERFLH